MVTIIISLELEDAHLLHLLRAALDGQLLCLVKVHAVAAALHAHDAAPLENTPRAARVLNEEVPPQRAGDLGKHQVKTLAHTLDDRVRASRTLDLDHNLLALIGALGHRSLAGVIEPTFFQIFRQHGVEHLGEGSVAFGVGIIRGLKTMHLISKRVTPDKSENTCTA